MAWVSCGWLAPDVRKFGISSPRPDSNRRASQPALGFGYARRLRTVSRTQLLNRVREVVAHSAVGQEQRSRDLVEVSASVGRGEDLSLPFGQGTDAFAQCKRSQTGIHHPLASGGAADGKRELLGRRVLEHEPISPGVHGATEETRFAKCREDETATLGQRLVQGRGR